MFHIVLHQPQIPPNTGNIIRLCANTGCQLHLIEPLGFEMSDKQLRRAGLDYHEYASVQIYKNFDAFMQAVKPTRVFAIETCGKRHYTDVQYQEGDALLFGSEPTEGVPQDILKQLPEEHTILIPMKPKTRSLNLSNCAALVVYEAWRQNGFTGAES